MDTIIKILSNYLDFKSKINLKNTSKIFKEIHVKESCMNCICNYKHHFNCNCNCNCCNSSMSF